MFSKWNELRVTIDCSYIYIVTENVLIWSRRKIELERLLFLDEIGNWDRSLDSNMTINLNSWQIVYREQRVYNRDE